MKHLRLILAVGILTMTLATVTAMAGQMPGGITSPPPPPAEASATGNLPMGATSTSTSSDASVTGQIPYGLTAEIDPVTGLALSVLQSLLALF